MAHAFTIVPAKPAFGNFSKNLNYSDVIAAKRANILYCDCKNSNNPNFVKTSSQLLEINKTRRNDCCDCDVFPFDKTSLSVNLVTTQYLPQESFLILERKTNPGVPSKLDTTLSPLFAFYNFDPDNKLIGNTPCGIQKFINYMILDVDVFINTQCPDDDFIPFCDCSFVRASESAPAPDPSGNIGPGGGIGIGGLG